MCFYLKYILEDEYRKFIKPENSPNQFTFPEQ